MFAALLMKEVRHIIMTFRFGIAFVSILILTLASFWVQADDYTRRLNNYNVTTEHDVTDGQNIYVPSQIQPVIHRTPSTLSIFAQGESGRYGDMVTLNRWLVPRESRGSFSNNNLLAALPNFDFLQITIIVISLFGAMLGFDGISGERENSTLRSMCASSVGRGTIYTAKFLGNAIMLALPILIAFLGGLLYLLLVKSISFSASHWGAIALIAIAAVLYGSLFIAISLLCSTLFKRSSISLVFTLGLWLFGSIAIPVFAKTIAEHLEPSPSPSELSNLEASSLRDAASAYEQFSERYPDHTRGIGTGSYGVGTGLGDGTIKFDGNETQFRQAEEYVRFMESYMFTRADQIWDAYRQVVQQHTRQARLTSLASMISPAHHVRKIFTALTGTGYQAYETFMDTARRSRREMLREFRQKGYFSDNVLAFFTRQPREAINDADYLQRREKYFSGEAPAGASTWGYLSDNNIPSYPDEHPEPAFDVALSHLAALFFAVPVLFVFGIFSFNRYDVR